MRTHNDLTPHTVRTPHTPRLLLPHTLHNVCAGTSHIAARKHTSSAPAVDVGGGSEREVAVGGGSGERTFAGGADREHKRERR